MKATVSGVVGPNACCIRCGVVILSGMQLLQVLTGVYSTETKSQLLIKLWFVTFCCIALSMQPFCCQPTVSTAVTRLRSPPASDPQSSSNPAQQLCSCK